ncbi:MAG: DUF5655 domain-containing protein [Actinomycetes bacterium]|nr:DUF5655 domain-containing protein [Actinomycetes bacterium]MDX5379790.1 DUF5655 domain-containing protein [Actinomycetes bacterium]MDX5398211.1 DUF5655 domain-containing protein [Actinomycetes bacterium]MDX5449484.1 DUF5655 domain-containing protein [Actinomycetes bacterium]
MALAPEVAVDEFLAGHAFAREVHGAVLRMLEAAGPFTARATRSQLAYRRRRAFAWLWLPGTWLARPADDVVLTIALGRHDPSPRFKEVAHPSPRHWVHHLEVRALADLDDDVAAWLREAYERAG